MDPVCSIAISCWSGPGQCRAASEPCPVLVGQSAFWLGLLSARAWHGLWSVGGLASAPVGAVTPSSLSVARQCYQQGITATGFRCLVAVEVPLRQRRVTRVTTTPYWRKAPTFLQPSMVSSGPARPAPAPGPPRWRWQPQEVCGSEDGTQPRRDALE